MYTQCPECNVAFRVTAEVLKQAAGKVRCGGCGVAFNALEHLSEEMPKAAARSGPDPQLPELTPDGPGELEADKPPKTISAEQSAALLKTLDQLAGEDIRIEDTGVEWRVLGADEENTEGAEDAVTDKSEPGLVREEIRFDDNTPLPEDFDLNAEPVPAPELEIDEIEPPPIPEDEQVDLALGDPDEWEDLLGDLNEADVPDTDVPPEELSRVGILDPDDGEIETKDADDAPLDMDTQFAIQAEAMGLDLSGTHESIDAEPEDKAETSIEEDLIAAAFESEAAAQVEIDPEELPPDELSRAGILDEDDYLEEIEEDLEDELEDELEELDDVAKLEEEEEAEETEEPDEPESAAEPDYEVPVQSEAEKTINLMIDQDLFAIAIEDEEGFTSTIVQKQVSSNDDIPEEETEEAVEEPQQKKSSPLVETIIMDGEFVRGDGDHDRLAADRKAASASLRKLDFDKDNESGRGGRYWNSPSYGMLAAAASLFIILMLQLVHNSREALATSPVFQNTVGPIYRMVGSPVTPTWDIKGWRFEATKGSTDDQVLTIYSRVGNKSQQALPYPLVHVSLTDRFEEIIGSRVLEPIEYLVGDADPRQAVQSGNTFDAVISIDSPSDEATGFKLNVCYRMASAQLRCAIEDFK